MQFSHQSHAVRVVFGPGKVQQLKAELQRLAAKRALFICTSSGRQRYRTQIESLGPLCAGVFDRVEPHCPQSIAEAALEEYRRLDADAVVALGGGSTIGVGKYIAANGHANVVAVPTTPSGSEMTSLYGVKIGLEKRTSRDDRVRPKSAIYDPELTLTLPAHETATIGMNCLAHCVEGLYAREPDPIAGLLAQDGIRALANGLPASCAQPEDIDARSLMLYAGFLGGLVVSMVGIALHHKLCHILGGHFGVPHGESNAVILPYVVAYNAPAAPQAMSILSNVFGSAEPALAIYELARRINAPRSLQELGMREEALEPCARELVSESFYNPRPVKLDEMMSLLHEAYVGRPPTTES